MRKGISNPTAAKDAQVASERTLVRKRTPASTRAVARYSGLPKLSNSITTVHICIRDMFATTLAARKQIHTCQVYFCTARECTRKNNPHFLATIRIARSGSGSHHKTIHLRTVHLGERMLWMGV